MSLVCEECETDRDMSLSLRVRETEWKIRDMIDWRQTGRVDR